MSTFFTSSFPLAVMDGKIEQRVCISFCVNLGNSATETLAMLCKAFGEHSCFKVCRVSVDQHSGCPGTSKTTENVEKVWKLVHEDHR
jgi:uncharacterized metal-binding protein